MASGAVHRQLDRAFNGAGVSGLSEGQLLERFVSRRDDSAFEALLARHGPMIYAVCRRHLRDPNDVDDAFQATFLILARRASVVRNPDALGGWLRRVSRRVASRARAEATRRARVERNGLNLDGTAAPTSPANRPEVAALREVIDKLSAPYRLPVVLCHLEGQTHD